MHCTHPSFTFIQQTSLQRGRENGNVRYLLDRLVSRLFVIIVYFLFSLHTIFSFLGFCLFCYTFFILFYFSFAWAHV